MTEYVKCKNCKAPARMLDEIRGNYYCSDDCYIEYENRIRFNIQKLRIIDKWVKS
jgi:hypothetical protein